ncbi:hypothetical protein MKW98_001643 [Papaver atlanticum]|uniref:1,8-cineole synthase n=1 Tax=Papaver atlanticum TaxID=357466 RepID=A0AAD4XB76_9MAGN|nr:hypothetical protein MKW98_001643 [Papaver atlanticum]
MKTQTQTTMTSSFLVSKIISSSSKLLSTHTHKYKLLQIIHQFLCIALYWIVFFLRLLPSLYPNQKTPSRTFDAFSGKREKDIIQENTVNGDSTSVCRALTQILSIINEIPVSSRKYELLRSLAEKLIEDNLKVGSDVLRDINSTVLSSAFAKTLQQLESAVMEEVKETTLIGSPEHRLDRILHTIWSYSERAWAWLGEKAGVPKPDAWTAEKFAAELLWLAKKMSSCGNVDVAVSSWGSASRLAWLSISADPRIQGSLVKISAFLLKEARKMGQIDEMEKDQNDDDENVTKMIWKHDEQSENKMKLLMSWLPFLCRASKGTDAPILSTSDRLDVERAIEDLIGTFRKDQQEKVLSLWLHHFTSCPLSDWPNLQSCYNSWLDASRKQLAI